MIVNEMEAVQLWCPHVRIVSVIGVMSEDMLVNSRGGARAWNTCLASRCSQWRWSPTPGAGYCGLAGVPLVRDQEG